MMLNKELCKKLGFLIVVKKPIPAYALQLIEENREVLKSEERLDFDNRTISTLEGVFHFDYGDYLIVGNENEIWTSKESIFNDTYEHRLSELQTRKTEPRWIIKRKAEEGVEPAYLKFLSTEFATKKGTYEAEYCSKYDSEIFTTKDKHVAEGLATIIGGTVEVA